MIGGTALCGRGVALLVDASRRTRSDFTQQGLAQVSGPVTASAARVSEPFRTNM